MSGWSVAATIVSAMASLVGALVLLNLRSLAITIRELKGDQGDQAKDIRELNMKFAACKVDCDRNTVSKEDWVRSEGYTRRGLDKLSQQMALMDGKLEVVQKLPEIAGGVARAVVAEMRKDYA
jgi:hypothetical protein